MTVHFTVSATAMNGATSSAMCFVPTARKIPVAASTMNSPSTMHGSAFITCCAVSIQSIRRWWRCWMNCARRVSQSSAASWLPADSDARNIRSYRAVDCDSHSRLTTTAKPSGMYIAFRAAVLVCSCFTTTLTTWTGRTMTTCITVAGWLTAASSTISPSTTSASTSAGPGNATVLPASDVSVMMRSCPLAVARWPLDSTVTSSRTLVASARVRPNRVSS